MNKKVPYFIRAFIILTMPVALLSMPTLAEQYEITWYTIDSGGGTSSGGPYNLTGTIGQPDADYLAGEQYELLGGFLVGGPLCTVNLEHFSMFATHWLDGPCNEEDNDWCGGADLNHLNDVNIDDLTILANEWLNVCPFNWPL